MKLIFGSTSDKAIAENIQGFYKRPIDIHYISAHRNLEQLQAFLQNNQEIVIGGAGLAAHLPGVISALTHTPTIGVPIKGQLSGIDSVMSIVQMPRGVPVLTTPVDGGPSLERLIKLLESNSSFNTLGLQCDKAIAQSAEYSKEQVRVQDTLGISLDTLISQQTQCDILLNWTHTTGLDVTDKQLIINIPYFATQDIHTPHNVLVIADMMAKGNWVGINNLTNALVWSQQLMHLN